MPVRNIKKQDKIVSQQRIETSPQEFLKDDEAKECNDVSLDGCKHEKEPQGCDDESVICEGGLENFIWLPVKGMTLLEEQELPLLATSPISYVKLRNHILSTWHKNPSQELTHEAAALDAPIVFHRREAQAEAIRLIHEFLSCHGHINVGVFAPKTPTLMSNSSTATAGSEDGGAGVEGGKGEAYDVIVVGGGIAGLAAASQLKRRGHKVVVLEAQSFIGGRARAGGWNNRDEFLTSRQKSLKKKKTAEPPADHRPHEEGTDGGASTALDFGAMIITGIWGNPIAMLCRQLGIKMQQIKNACPLLDAEPQGSFKDVSCRKLSPPEGALLHHSIPKDVDNKIQSIFNKALTAACNKRKHLADDQDLSLGEELLRVLHNYKFSQVETRVLNWHIANLEYGCGAPLDEVSLRFWDQDDAFGFGGPHCLIPGGYQRIAEELAKEVEEIRLNAEVARVRWTGRGGEKKRKEEGEETQELSPPSAESKIESLLCVGAFVGKLNAGTQEVRAMESVRTKHKVPEGWRIFSTMKRVSTSCFSLSGGGGIDCDVVFQTERGVKLRSIGDAKREIKRMRSGSWEEEKQQEALHDVNKVLRDMCRLEAEDGQRRECERQILQSLGLSYEEEDEEEDEDDEEEAETTSEVSDRAGEWEEGMEVEMYFSDGMWYRGRVTSLEDKVAVIDFEDGDRQTVRLPDPDVRPVRALGSSYMQSKEEEKETEEEEKMKCGSHWKRKGEGERRKNSQGEQKRPRRSAVDQQLQVGDEAEVLFSDGVWYRGRVTARKENLIHVAFADGDRQSFLLPDPDVRPATAPSASDMSSPSTDDRSVQTTLKDDEESEKVENMDREDKQDKEESESEEKREKENEKSEKSNSVEASTSLNDMDIGSAGQSTLGRGSKLKYHVGMQVEMFFDDGVWYRGRVASLLQDVATVFFEDGDVQQVSLPHPDVRPARPPPPVRVHTRDGQTLRSRAVLLCVPMGVIQQGAMKFEPSLPSWKHEAIRRAGNGLINKLTIEYREVFWDPQVDFFGTTSSVVEERGAFFLVWSLFRFTGRPILIAVLSGAAARKYESLPDDTVVRRFHEAITSIFGHVPQPERSHVTRWGSNPHARGAYSFVKVGSKGGPDYDLLAEPVAGQVFFAGEGTCREHPATAAGAYLTGLREAARLHRLLSEMKGEARDDR